MMVAGKNQSKLFREKPVALLPLYPSQPHADWPGIELGQP